MGSRYHALAFAFSNSSFLPTDVFENARIGNDRRAKGDVDLRRHDRHNDMLNVWMVEIKIKLVPIKLIGIYFQDCNHPSTLFLTTDRRSYSLGHKFVALLMIL